MGILAQSGGSPRSDTSGPGALYTLWGPRGSEPVRVSCVSCAANHRYPGGRSAPASFILLLFPGRWWRGTCFHHEDTKFRMIQEFG